MYFTGNQFEPHWAVVANLNGSIFLAIVDILFAHHAQSL
jgi:hypothetical protein